MRNHIVTLALALFAVTPTPAFADDAPEEALTSPDWMVTLGSRSEVWGSTDLGGVLSGFGHHGATLGVERRVLDNLWVGADFGGRLHTAQSGSEYAQDEGDVAFDSRHTSVSVTGGLLLRPELELNRWVAVSLPVSVRPRWMQSLAKTDVTPELVDALGIESTSYSASVSATVGVAFDVIFTPNARMRLGADVASVRADFSSFVRPDERADAWSMGGGASLVPTLALAAAF